MQDLDSNDSDYRDPTSDYHDVRGLSSGGVADKEMDDVPPTIEMLAKQASPLVSVQQSSELRQILARLVIDHEEKRGV